MWCDLYFIADPARIRRGSLPDVVRAALDGGATAVQLRDKQASTRALVEEALELRRLTRERGAAFLVNDRLDVALAVGADGVHLGPDDLPLALARRLLPGGMHLGFSASTPDEALAAERAGATYLGVGPVAATTTKPDAGPPIGVEGVAPVCAVVRLPIVAVGGITPALGERLVSAGASGVAVAAAISGAADATAATRALAAAIVRGRAARVEETAGATGDAP